MFFGVGERAFQLIQEHMRTCERDKLEVKNTLADQNKVADQRHTDNVANIQMLLIKISANELEQQKRFNKLMAALLGAILSGLVAVGVSFVNNYNARFLIYDTQTTIRGNPHTDTSHNGNGNNRSK